MEHITIKADAATSVYPMTWSQAPPTPSRNPHHAASAATAPGILRAMRICPSFVMSTSPVLTSSICIRVPSRRHLRDSAG